MSKITVKNIEVTVIKIDNEDYICITDMIKAKDGEFFVTDWLRNRNTLEYIGIWEQVYNPNFNYGEFAIIKNKAGLNSFKISAKEWRETNPDLKGNIRDYATINELICLSNMENLNAVFINEKLPQSKRLIKLNQIAIQQMTVLENIENRKLLK